jgi:rhomboid protease GluP
LLAGFAHTGIDNAAHLGGIGAGFFIGLVMARPVTGERSYTRSDMRRFLQMVPVAAVLLAVGLWFAQQASASLGGEGLYWHTIHWFGPRERRANIKFNAALALFKADPQNQLALANRLESDVLPFWREAVTRITAVHLPPNSPQAPNLEFLQNISTGRVTGYELFALALQTNDRKTAASAQREMKRIDDLIQERNATDGRTP